MFLYTKKLLELEHIIDLCVASHVIYVIPRPIKQIQNILIQDKNFILAAS